MDDICTVKVITREGESFTLDETHWLAQMATILYRQKQDPNYEQRKKHFEELRAAIKQLKGQES